MPEDDRPVFKDNPRLTAIDQSAFNERIEQVQKMREECGWGTTSLGAYWEGYEQGMLHVRDYLLDDLVASHARAVEGLQEDVRVMTWQRDDYRTQRDALRDALTAKDQQLTDLVKLEAAYRENEQSMLRRLSYALTRGNASQWEELVHAAKQAETALAEARQQLAALRQRLADWLDGEQFDAVAYAYRSAPTFDQDRVIAQFNALKDEILSAVLSASSATQGEMP
jgi:chromosome segregation ATPase